MLPLLARFGALDDTSSRLAERDTARVAFHDFVAKAGDWPVAPAILDAMATWSFANAKEAMDALCALVEAGVLAGAEQATAPPTGSVPPRPVLRGLCMAVVDEADSILIDDARTPLILSRPTDARAQGERLRLALFLARQLREGQDFDLADATVGPRLTPAGRARLGQLCERMDDAWAMQRWREEQILLALAALRQFHRDVHYLVRDGGVHIVDANTGRIAIGRMWSRGIGGPPSTGPYCGATFGGSDSLPSISSCSSIFHGRLPGEICRKCRYFSN